MGDFKSSLPPELQHIQQACSLHLGIVRDVRDPEGRGRVRVEVPGLNSVGNENWLNWCEVIGVPQGAIYDDGDAGMWWPMLPGQAAYVGFLSGDYLQPYCIPGPAWAEKPRPEEAWIPREARNRSLRRKTKIRAIKSEAGHTLLMDDNNGQEQMALMDWTGQGLFFTAPGGIPAAREDEEKGSKYRQGYTRGTRMTAAGNGIDVANTCNGQSAIALFDLLAQGLITVARTSGGIVLIWAGESVGKAGPTIMLDAQENRIIIAAGKAQMHFHGDEERIFVTKQMIGEIEPVDLAQYVGEAKNIFGQAFFHYHLSEKQDDRDNPPKGGSGQ